MTLPEFGVKRPVTATMIFLALLLLAIVALTRLPIDLMPEIEPPAISVITPYFGASARDVEEKVTKYIEKDLSIVSNLDRIQSRSIENLSIVTCIFDWGTDLDEASNEIRDRLEFSKIRIPDDAEEPMIFKFNTAILPILFYGVTAKESSPNLAKLIEDEVGDKLQTVPGVGAVQVLTMQSRQINVYLDLHKLEAFNITPDEISQALAAENITLPAGSIKEGRFEYALRVPGEYKDVNEIQNIIVKKIGNRLVYLKDVAQVEDSFKEPTRYISVDFDQGVLFFVQKRSGANTVQVERRVQKKLAEIKQWLPPDVKIIEIFNTADFIKRSLTNLGSTIIWCTLAVALVVFFFLRQIFTSLIICLTLPFSLTICFLILYLFDYTINTMSLSAIAIAIGMVVDNAVVILDNITRHIEKGERPSEAAIFGATEVGLAISASTFTTIIVFVPLMFLTGIVGIIFRQLGIAISAALLASLFLALTLTPMLCARLPNPSRNNPTRRRLKLYEISEQWFHKLEIFYQRLLALALKHRWLFLAGFLVAFSSSLLLYPFIGKEFAPEEDTGDISITMELAPGTRVEESERIARQVAEIFRSDVPEARHIYYRAGQSEEGISSAFGEKEGSHIAEVGAKLVEQKLRKRSTVEVANAIRQKIEQMPGIRRLDVMSGDPFAQLILGNEKPITIEVRGFDLEQTTQIAEKIKTIVANVPGTTDVSISRDIGKPELYVVVDRLKASALGISLNTITNTLRTLVYGKEATKFREKGDEYKIFVRLNEEFRKNINDIKQLSFRTLTGELVKLSEFAEIMEVPGPTEIERKNQERLVKVGANTYGRSLGDIAADIKRQLSRLRLPPDISIYYAGEIEEQRKAMRDLNLMLIVGITLVYMIMASQFESLLLPFILMFSVPFAVTGVLVALFITGMTINIVSMIGIILLIGIVVNNAIVLVDYINILRARGLQITEAITQAGANRLRPVLMTSLTTILGMLPLAFSTGEGSATWRPLSITVIGGLSLSTFVTLILVPLIYSIIGKYVRRLK